MMKKLIFLAVLFTGIAGLCFAQTEEQETQEQTQTQQETPQETQEQAPQDTTQNAEELNTFSDLFKDSTVEGTKISEVEESLQNKSFIHQIDFVFGLTPLMTINTKTKDTTGKFVSSPLQIHFPIYVGMNLPNYTYISFQPSLKFFRNYSLLADVDGTGNILVLPADLEGRTAQTWNFLLNLPVTFKLNFFDKNSLNVITGLALLIRFATVPNGIDASEEGLLGSVKTDVDYMNSWFWQKGRFLYLSAGVNWLFYRGTLKFGPEFFIDFPISIFADKKFDAIFSAGLTIQL